MADRVECILGCLLLYTEADCCNVKRMSSSGSIQLCHHICCVQDFCRRITEAASRTHSLGDLWGLSAYGASLSTSGVCSPQVHLSLSDSLAAQLTWIAPSLLPPSLVLLQANADTAPVGGSACSHHRLPSLPESAKAELMQPSLERLATLLVPGNTDQLPCSSWAGPSLMSIPARRSPMGQMPLLEASDSGSQPKRGASAESACKWPHSINLSMEASCHEEHVPRTQYSGADVMGNSGYTLLERMASRCNNARQSGSRGKAAVQTCEVASQSFSSGAAEDIGSNGLILRGGLNPSDASPSQPAAAWETSSICKMKSGADSPASLAGTGYAQVRPHVPCTPKPFQPQQP